MQKCAGTASLTRPTFANVSDKKWDFRGELLEKYGGEFGCLVFMGAETG
jgi:hypothetical protein